MHCTSLFSVLLVGLPLYLSTIAAIPTSAVCTFHATLKTHCSDQEKNHIIKIDAILDHQGQELLGMS